MTAREDAERRCFCCGKFEITACMGFVLAGDLATMMVRFGDGSTVSEAPREFCGRCAEIFAGLMSAALSAAYTRGQDDMRERAAGVAGIWPKTDPVFDRSSNAVAAAIIATVISDTGHKIATAIRALPITTGEAE